MLSWFFRARVGPNLQCYRRSDSVPSSFGHAERSKMPHYRRLFPERRGDARG
jgi:hypothetical protein